MPFGLISGLIDSGVNAINNKKNFELQSYYAGQNLKLQKEQFQYLKEQNALQQQREDTAVQRQVKDLQGAGINKLYATNMGGASTGATGSTTSFSGVEAPQQAGTDWRQEGGQLESAINSAQGIANVYQTKAQTELTKQEIANMSSKKLNIEADTLLKEAMSAKTKNEKDEILQKIKNLSKEYDSLEHNYNIARQAGTPVGVDPKASNIYESIYRIAGRMMYGDKFGYEESSEDKQVRKTQSDRQLRAQLWKEYKSELKRNKWNENDLRFEQYLKNRGYDSKIGL